MKSENRIIRKLVEMDAYLREKVVTKGELKRAKSEIMTHIDGLSKRQDTFDHELVSVRNRMDRLEGKA